jgi:hypothetical protein
MMHEHQLNMASVLIAPAVAAVLTFFILALFDALIGGAISALLRIEGWTSLDQRINDVYMVNYAVIVAAALAWFHSHFRQRKLLIGLVFLFLGYVEDTVFYCLTPLVNPFIKMLTRGELFIMPSGKLFPDEISGWLGWLGRAFFGGNIALDMAVVLALNAIAIFIALFLFFTKSKIGNQKTASKPILDDATPR